ncbi:hypothetical protein JFU47_12230 [Pseudomonas sp. TH39(2020)]|uniref:hypothetical protein n=1 Tax=Pseudomonas sp. TH39(2020) TaxID=2796349 RepID=UPI001911DEBB|nr:hypothetical protein [Pseudomonas sp. TH39(2020)]MBK5397464.1 hypothetical protein [Pseudomonas sp. TH39(2020)]
MPDRNARAVAYAGTPAVRATTRVAGEHQEIIASPVTYGGAYDICLPTDNEEQSRRMFRDFAISLNAKAEESGGKFFQGLLKAPGAGQLYELQIRESVARFSKVADEIATEVRTSGKYTKELAQKLIEARQTMTHSLKDIFPAVSRFQSSVPIDELESTLATQNLVADEAALAKLTGRPERNFTRNIIKRGQQAITYVDENPIKLDLRLAERLKGLEKFMVVVELAPAISLLLTSNNEREQQAALIALTSKTSGVLADALASQFMMGFCVGFGLTTAGWGFLVCGTAAIAIGIYAGTQLENHMNSKLTQIALPPTLP